MHVSIDVGNTQLVLGCCVNDRWLEPFRFASSRLDVPEELRSFLKKSMGHASLTSVGIASVRADAFSILDNAIQDMFQFKAAHIDMHFVLQHRPQTVQYAQPLTLGIDRYVNTYAAYRAWGMGVMVIDAGTATTIDIMSPEGVFMGGVIAPGMLTAAAGLAQAAPALPHVVVSEPVHVCGRSTVECMQSGQLIGHAAMIDGLVERLRETIDFKTRIVLTGGLSSVLMSHLRAVEDMDNVLTLKGIAALTLQALGSKKPL